jgi:hypothetical protein
MKNEKVFLQIAIAPNHRRDLGGADGRQTRTAFAFLTSGGVRAGFPNPETQKKQRKSRKKFAALSEKECTLRRLLW